MCECWLIFSEGADVGQNPSDHEVRGGSGHRVRRERDLRRVPFARLRGRQRDGVLRLVQHLRAPGVLRNHRHPRR